MVLEAHGVNPANSIYASQFGQTNSFYSFGTTGATAATAYFTLQNNTQNTLNLGTDADTFTGGNGIQIGLSGNDTDFTLSKVNGANGTKCGATLGVGASCTFALVFLPTWDTDARLYRWTTVTVAGSNVLGAIGRVQMPALLQLTAASAGQVKVNAATTSVDFGQILQGQTPSVVFTIKNIGEAASGTPVALTLTPGASNYVVLGASTCGTTALAPQQTCTVTVNTQLVSAIGAKTGASVQATDGTASHASDSYSLSAQVVNPASITVDPSATAFAATPAGSTAAPITITVTNGSSGDDATTRQSTGALSVVLSDTTNFSVDPTSTCLNTAGTAYQGLPLTAGANTGDESCTIIVNFKPAAAGAKTTTVTVSATPGGSPAAITLTGTGNSTLTSNPTSFTSPQTSFQFTHSGTGTTGVLRETLTGANASVYTIISDDCFGAKLTGSDTCTVVVAFLGTSSATAAQTATLTVTDGTANNTGTVNLSVGGP